MSLFAAALLGIVEGITEFLPISSTGHLILAEKIFGITINQSVETFDIAIQLGAVAAVALISWRTFLRSKRVTLLVLAAFVPTGIIGLLVHRLVKTYLLGNVTLVLWALSIGGVVLIIFELFKRKPRISGVDQFSFPLAVAIGIFQSLAIVPGVSRSAATIVGGMLLGTDRRSIVEFSFLLAIPTMAAATGLDLVKSASSLSLHDMAAISVGFAFSFITALIAIKWLLRFIKTHTFIPFGIERIFVAVLVWLMLIK
jgi:undecaprenyl-diphosphatase